MGRKLLTLGLVALVAGCGSSQPAAAPQASKAQLIRRCMAAHGFTLPTPRVTAAFRRAMLGTPRQVGTLRLPGGVIVRYRTHGCYPQAIAQLYGSVRRYQEIVAARNMLGQAPKRSHSAGTESMSKSMP